MKTKRFPKLQWGRGRRLRPTSGMYYHATNGPYALYLSDRHPILDVEKTWIAFHNRNGVLRPISRHLTRAAAERACAKHRRNRLCKSTSR